MVRLVHLIISTMIFNLISSEAMPRLSTGLKKVEGVLQKRAFGLRPSKNHNQFAPKLQRKSSSEKNWQFQPDQVLFVPRDYLEQFNKKTYATPKLGDKYKAFPGNGNFLSLTGDPSNSKMKFWDNIYTTDVDGTADIKDHPVKMREQRQPVPPGQEHIIGWQGPVYGIPDIRNNHMPSINQQMQKPFDNALTSIVSKMTPEAQNALIDALLKTIASKRGSDKSDPRNLLQLQNGNQQKLMQTRPANLDIYPALNEQISDQKIIDNHLRPGNTISDNCCIRDSSGRSRNEHMKCRPTLSPQRNCNHQMRQQCNRQSAQGKSNHQSPQRGKQQQKVYNHRQQNGNRNSQQRHRVKSNLNYDEAKVVNLTQIFNVRPRMLVVNSNLPFEAKMPITARYYQKRGT